ncbi:MAG TPA: hypothetical protein VG935_01355 [Patescibacteria group bacterium]|nr:hypothetical protein [Patescibacteria group bacterium]
MHEYIFVLGRYPELSTEEILAVAKRENLSLSIIDKSSDFLVVQSPSPLDLSHLNSQLGGTVKIGTILSHMPLALDTTKLEDYLTSDSLFTDILHVDNDKVTFGISYYSVPGSTPFFTKQTIARLLKLIKHHLELQSFKARFPNHQDLSLSSASVEKNKLLTSGAEILLVQTKTELLVGKTVAVQEFEAFSQRDYGRPMRDMDSGIMPPKIARMMLNLTEISHQDPILDPFCGSGTILQEAMLLGFTHITGTDSSGKAVTDSQTNNNWLRSKFNLENKPSVSKVDVRSLSETFPEQKFAAIVTEPYMGPNLQQRQSLPEIQKIRLELRDLYLTALQQFFAILRPQGVIVMVLPIFHAANQYLPMEILSDAGRIGLQQIPLSQKRRQTLIVGNNRDFVLREIVKFVRQ